MYCYLPAETMADALQLVCYVFTVISSLASCLLALR